MQQAQTAHDVLRGVLGWAVGATEIVAGLFAFYFLLKAIALLIRQLDNGDRARAIAARARIEAQMRARAERAAAPAAPRGDAHDPAQALRRRLLAIDEILRSSSFEGERTAALAARARVEAQLDAVGE